MVNYNSVVSQVQPPDYREKKIQKYQNTNDIIKDLVYCFKNYNYQADPIKNKFATGNIKTAGKRIYDFIKKNIRYEAEEDKQQTSKSFSRIIHDAQQGIGHDCKHSALVVSCIGWNLGYNVIFRFVAYNVGESFGHVYTILQDPITKERVIVDPLQKFDTEKPYIKRVNYLALNNLKKNKMLSRLTGTNSAAAQFSPYDEITTTRISDTIGQRGIVLNSNLDNEHIGELETLSGLGKRSKSERKEARQKKKSARVEKRADKKEVRQEKKSARVEKRGNKKEARQEKRADRKEARGGSGVLKTVALAPIRGAFSALVLINFRDLGRRLSLAIDKNETAVQKLAAKFGYKYDIFKSQIKKGATKPALFGGKVTGVYQVQGIGSLAVTAGAIAAAAPAIAAALELLKSLGIGAKSGAPSDEEIMKKAADDIQSNGEPKTEEEIDKIKRTIETAKDIIESVTSSPAEKAAAQEALDKAEDALENSEAPGFLDTIKNLPTPVLVIGGIGLAFVAGKALKLF